MLVTQYTHRLPADYPMERIRQRATARGPDWDAMPGLIFKGFLIRERGNSGAESNSYSSLYLWDNSDAFAAMIAGERFKAVIDTFGRPSVETFIVIASAFDPNCPARFVHRTDSLIAPGTDLKALREQEERAVRLDAARGDTFASLSVLDVSAWKLSRFTFTVEEAPKSKQAVITYEVAYLAKPGTNKTLERSPAHQ